ncbi:MAG TPA: hypothetical protein VGQ26_09360 [Streptosporangiaceae bacterium]|nr:hypothetical protein [Streptosporangiaceae bacterium]
MGGGSLAVGPGGLSQQVVPGRLLAAKITLWKFDQQRRGRLADRGEVADGHQAVRAARRAPGQAVQALVCLALVPVQVTHGVKDDRLPVPPVGVHPQHALLGHCPAGQEHRRWLAKQPGDLGL